MALTKGSPAAKAWGRKMKRLRNASKPKRKKSRSSSVRRKTIKRRTRSTMAKKKKKKKRSTSRKRSTSIWGINLGKAGSAGLYGAMRARLSNTIRPYTQRLPLGVVSDEIGMVIALQALKKFAFKRAGILRDAATHGQSIEFARIGEAAASGQINLGMLSPSPQSNGNLF